MHTQPQRPSGSGEDTLPEFPAIVDAADGETAGSDFAEIARNVRRRGAVRRTGEAFAEFAKEMPEMVIGFVEGLLP
jgi:hypothetical protein